METLYAAYSVAPALRKKDEVFENVKINWFVVDRAEPAIPYEYVLEEYWTMSTIHRADAEIFVKELFTYEELQQLKIFLKEEKNLEMEFEEVKIPVVGNVKPWKHKSELPGSGYYRLHTKDTYYLPFKVEGYYNIKYSDQQIVPDNQKTVISRELGKELQEQLQKKYFDGSDS